MARITIAEAHYYDRTTSTAGVIYARKGGKAFTTGPSDDPPNEDFLPRLTQPVRIKIAMFGNGATFGNAKAGTGEARWENKDGELDVFQDYAFDGRDYFEWEGPETGTFPTDFTKIQHLTQDRPPDISTDEVRFSLRDRFVELGNPFQTTKYAGNNVLPAGLEGVADLKGKPKPWIFGDVFQYPAVLVNSAKHIYQAHDGTLQSVADVRDRGISLLQTPRVWEALVNGVDTTDFRAVTVKGADDIIAGGALGVIRRSDDAGASFSTPTSPFTAGSAGGAPTLLATGTLGADGFSGTAPSRESVIIITGGENRLLAARISLHRVVADDQEVASVVSDLDGALTQHATAEILNARAELWYLQNPSEGTHTVTATLANGKQARFIIATHCYQDVDQGTLPTAVTATGTSTGPATVTVSSDTSDLVVDVFAKEDTNEAVTKGSGQTVESQGETNHATSSRNIQHGSSSEAGAASVVMDWTWPSGSRDWAIIGLTLPNVAVVVPTVTTIAHDASLDIFVAGTIDGQLAYSTDDGATWTAITGASNPFEAGDTPIKDIVANGDGVFIAVGGTIVAKSTNGTSFTSKTTALTGAICAAVFGDLIQRWAIYTATDLETSDDAGDTWDAQDAPAVLDGVSIVAAAYGRGLYVLVYGGAAKTAIASSGDAINYTLRYETTQLGASDIAFGGKAAIWVVSGNHSCTAGGRALSSADAVEWSLRTTTIVGANASKTIGVGASDDLLVIAAENGKLEKPASAGTYASEADLLDDTKKPAEGTFKAYLAGGYFRLGSPAVGLITSDLLQGAAASNRTAGQAFAAIMTKAGKGSDYSTADVTALDLVRTAEIGLATHLAEVTPIQLLNMAAASVEAWWRDIVGTYRIKLGPSTSGTSVLDIVKADLKTKARLLRTADPGGGLPTTLVKVLFRKNYAPQGTDLAANVSDANRGLFAEPWREETAEDTAVLTAHLLARTQVVQTALAKAADASAAATRRGLVYDSPHQVLELPLELNEATQVLELGDVVNVTLDRFGLESGADFAILEMDPNRARRLLTLRVWRELA